VPVYPAYLEVSTPQRRLLTHLLREQRQGRHGRPRALAPGRQALLVLARLRNNDTDTRLAKGFGIGLATAHRYVTEAVGLLAARAPSLPQALKIAARKAYVILDGTLVPRDRVRTHPRGSDKDHFSGKIGSHAMNVQVIAGPAGEVIGASPALPGAQHDITAARTHTPSRPSRTRERGCRPTRATREQGPRSASRCAPDARTPTPGPTCHCRPTSRPTTPPTPGCAPWENERTLN
jgi:hypothetical protein